MEILLIFSKTKPPYWRLLKFNFKTRRFHISRVYLKYLKKAIDDDVMYPVKYELDGYIVDFPLSKLAAHILQPLEHVNGFLIIDYVYTKLLLTMGDVVSLEMILKLKQPVIEDEIVHLFNQHKEDFNERIEHFKKLKVDGKWLSFRDHHTFSKLKASGA